MATVTTTTNVPTMGMQLLHISNHMSMPTFKLIFAFARLIRIIAIIIYLKPLDMRMFWAIKTIINVRWIIITFPNGITTIITCHKIRCFVS